MGEEDGYVTAGYGHHKGECRLLLLPTHLIYLIIWPSRWLKACCVATWHAVAPTLLSDESFVLYYQTVNFWGNSNQKQDKTRVNLISVRSPTTAISILKSSTLWRPTWGWCNLWNTSVRCSAPFTRTNKMPYYIQLNFSPRTAGLFLKNIIMADLYLKAQGFRKGNCTLNLSHWSITLTRHRITGRSNISLSCLCHWRSDIWFHYVVGNRKTEKPRCILFFFSRFM